MKNSYLIFPLENLRIMELNTGKLSTLLSIDAIAGHRNGKPISKITEEYTDIYAFVFYHLGMDLK